MRLFVLILLLFMAPGLAAAQDPLQPILRTELEKQKTVPGQPISPDSVARQPSTALGSVGS